MLRFSDEVKAYIATLDLESDRDLKPQEREEAKTARRMVKVVVSEVVNSRETLTDGKLKGIESLVQSIPEDIAAYLDERFTRDVINSVPGYVRRTLDLSRMEAVRTPSTITNTYLREATRAYVMGLPQACIALCRATLEQALKEQLGRQLSGTFVKFHDLIDEAYKYHLLDRTTKAIAREVANDADEVLHEKPSDPNQAEGVLIKLRGLVQHIYSAEGRD